MDWNKDDFQIPCCANLGVPRAANDSLKGFIAMFQGFFLYTQMF